MNRILYLDFTSHGAIHEIYNSSSAYMLSIIFNQVDYYASKESIDATKMMFESKPAKIFFHKIFIPNPNKSKFHLFLFYFLPIIRSLYFMIKAKKNDVLFFNSNPPWAFPFINIFARFIKNKIIIVFHGELEFLVNNNKQLNRFSQNSITLLTKPTFKISNNLYLCSLGEGIKKRLITLVSDNIKNQIIHFEHTAIFRKPNQEKFTDNEKIKIGITGTINPAKSSLQQILNFAKLLQEIQNTELYVIGRIYCSPLILSNVGIKFIQGADSKSLSRQQIYTKILEMDYLVYLYPTDSYKLTSSGAVFDSISAEKYILALKNHYFVDMLDRGVFPGCLFENIDDIIKFIKLNGKNIPIVAYSDIKNKLSPQLEAFQFLKRLKEFKIIN